MKTQKISILNKNQLPKFMEEFIGAAAKTIDALDLSKDDGWLTAIPFGKLAGYAISRLIEIRDENQALNKGIGFACAATFSKGILRNGLNPIIDQKDYQDFERTLKVLLKSKNIEIGSFQRSSFWDVPLVQEYIALFIKLLQDSNIPDEQITRIQNYLFDYCELQFQHLLRSDSTVYNKLIDYLKSPVFKKQSAIYRLETYRAGLKNQYTEITLRDSAGLTLDYIYQKPLFSVFEGCTIQSRLGKNFAREVFIPSQEVGVKEDIHEFVIEWVKSKLSIQALRNDQSRILFLYGYPGQGKTSFCKRLVYDLFSEFPIENPVYMVRFRNLSEPELLKSEILATIADFLKDRFGLELIPKELEKSFLILDGLDELLMKNKLSSSDISEIVRNIINEAHRYPELKILVTSRFGYLDLERLPTNEILILQLQQFTLSQQLDWLRAYLDYHPECWLTKEKLKQINFYDGYLRELVPQPILLHMIASIRTDLTDIVGNRARVYELLFDQICDPRKWKTSQIDLLLGLEKEDLRMALREIAFVIFQTGDGYIHKTALEKLREVVRLQNKLLGRSTTFEEALRFMMVAFYFQEIRKHNRRIDETEDYNYAIEFLHKSLQEYLTAEYIWFILKEKFLDLNRRGDYILEGDDAILDFLCSILGNQMLSAEVSEYLKEVISNDKAEADKVELFKRLDSSLEYLIEKQFLAFYDSANHESPADLTARTFYGFWTIYVNLQEDTELFESDHRRNKVLSFLKYIGFNLRSQGVQSLCFSGVKFTDIDLSGVCLWRGDFREAIFANSVLVGAYLRGADFSSATFYHSRCNGVDMSDAYFNEASIIETEFNAANLQYANLSDAVLTKSHLNLADLTGADLIQADLSEASFIGAKFHETNLAGSFLTNSVLFGANIYYADLQNSKLNEADLSHSNLQNVILKEATLKGANLSHATISETSFTDANLNTASLYEADLSKIDLVGAVLLETNFKGAYLEEIDFTEADLSQASFEQSELSVINFTRADLLQVNFDNAILSEVNFTGARIDVLQLVKAKSLDRVTGLCDEDEIRLLELRGKDEQN